MIFWIFVFLTIVGFVLAALSYEYNWSEGLEILGVIVGTISAITAIIMLMFIIACNCNTDGQIAGLEAERESLVYQLEAGLYDNDNDIGKRELMHEIQEWNKDIAMNRKAQDDFWIGIFVPDIYYDIEPIPLEVE